MKKLFTFFICIVLTVGLFSQDVFKNPIQLFEKAQQLQSQEKYYEAIELYQQALYYNPSYGSVWFALAECTYAIEEYDLAMTYIKKAKEFLSDEPKIINMQGFIEIGLGNLSQARTTFLSVLAKFPNDVDARFGLAELELFEGKISGAEYWYEAALQRQNTNRRALLSLALISYELGKIENTKKYIEQALNFHSGRSEVYYFASYLQMLEGNLENAEGKVRSAIALNKNYDAAYELLSIILFKKKRFDEVINICDIRIEKKRDAQSAWYMKALSLEKIKQVDLAYDAFAMGLEIAKDNEVMRSAFEKFLEKNFAVENSKRQMWAKYHTEKAIEKAQRFISNVALYEFQRSLRINPLDNDVRMKYADLVLREGYKENYLQQIKFIQKTNNTRNINEIIESYESSLRGSLANRWKVNNLLLEKNRIKLGIYPVALNPQLIHIENEKIASWLLADYFTSFQYFSVNVNEDYVTGYTQAFSTARKLQQDYFALLSVEESEREITVTLNLYSGRTGNEAGKFKVYRTGNYRFASCLQKIAEQVKEQFPIRGKIIDRKNEIVLVDVGLLDGVKIDDVFTIVKKDRLNTADTGIGLSCKTTDIFGTVTITNIGEEISQGVFKTKGFYDRINIGDEVFLATYVDEINDEESAELQKKGLSLFKKKKTEELEKKPSLLEDFELELKKPLLLQLIQNVN
ncbi:MAG: tetratricopeptide repeat protein [Treponema sp.]|nr:tetratricopeptide repeat protein [Treponema sp.]